MVIMDSPSSATRSTSERQSFSSSHEHFSPVDDPPTAPSAFQDFGSPSPAHAVSPSQTASHPSSSVPYTVFISHAGEDKATIAFPLRDRLRDKRITAFVDEADMPCGTDAIDAMTLAMETAKIGVFILSPEFIARKWPMKELMCFLKRRQPSSCSGHSVHEAPTVIPCFYRLSVADLYQEPNLYRKDQHGRPLYVQSRFFERRDNGEPEADVGKVKVALKTLHGIMGVRNDVDANNDSSYLMTKRRNLLLDELCNEICKSLPASLIRTSTSGDSAHERNCGSSQGDGFRRSFPPKHTGERAVLDFDSRDEEGNPMTPEGRVKKYLLEEDCPRTRIVSLCGIGGVGKSTVIEMLINDDDIRTSLSDGIHLIKLGRHASIKTLCDQLYKVLRNSGANTEVQSLCERNNIDEVLDFFMTWFEGRRCGFFIDDVWERSNNAGALSHMCSVTTLAGGNRVLITTREHEIASLTRDTRIVPLDPRESNGKVAREILLFHAAVAKSDGVLANAADSIAEILGICAGLPVSLAVAGKNVRKLIRLDTRDPASAWARYLSRLKTSRQTLLRQNVGSYGNLYATFTASLEFLDESNTEEKLGFLTKFSFSEMHRRLCVIQKQVAVPNKMLMHLWGTESEESAEVIATVFVEVGLVSRETVRFESEFESRFSLHDSIHDFAVSEARQHGEIASTHNFLLEGYRSWHEKGPRQSDDMTVIWSSKGLRDDGYIHKHLCRHLAGGGREKELCDVLLTPLWAERQIEVNGIMYLEDDFGTGMTDTAASEETKEALHLISNAISLSSPYIVKNMTELWFQLHGRLRGCVESNTKIEKYVKSVETGGEKPRVLSINRAVLEAGGRITKTFSIWCSGVLCLALFHDGARVACGCWDGSVIVVNIRRSEIERKWKAYSDTFASVSSIAVARNGSLIVTRPSYLSYIDVWDAESGHHVRTIGRQHDDVYYFSTTCDGSCVVSVSRLGSLKLWNFETGEVVAPTINVGSNVRGISLLRDGEKAIILYDGMLKVWNVRTCEQITEFGDETISRATANGTRMCCFSVTPDGRRVVSSFNDGTAALWDLNSRRQTRSSETNHRTLRSLAMSKDGSRIVSGDDKGGIQIWDVESGDQLCEPLKGHTSLVSGVSFIGNNDSIVSCSWDGTVRVWNIVRGAKEKKFDGHEARVMGVAFTPDGKYVVTGSSDCTLRVWDAVSGRAVGGPLHGHSEWVTDVAVTSNDRFVLSVSLDRTVRVWDLESRNLLHTLRGHSHSVQCVALTPKGDGAVTGSDDKTVRMWDLTKMDGSHVVYEGPNDGVRSVFVSDDGLRIISVDGNDGIFVWSIETKDILKTAKVDFAWTKSRRDVFHVIGEDTVHDDAQLCIPIWSKQITHGKGSEARVLATLESEIRSWDISADKKTVCLGLEDGRMALLKVDV